MDRQKVTVTGYVDRGEALRAARRTGRAAEFWPWPYDGEYYPFAIQYLEDNTYMATNKYYRHGYNGDKHGQLHEPHRGADPVSNMFNDDDVNACSVM